MLLKFAVQNFRGFSNRVEWDLSHPNHYDFNLYALKNGVLKNGIIYGPNGSGKTNFGLAIFDIVNHLTQKMKKVDYYSNFAFAGKPFSSVCFEYTFQFGDKRAEYTYSKDHEGRLERERLSIDGRVYVEWNANVVQTGEFTMSDQVKLDFLKSRQPVSLLSYLWSNYPLSDEHILFKIRGFVDAMLWYQCLDRREFIGFDSAVTNNIEDFIIRNSLVDDFAHFLAEVSGQKFRLESSQPNATVSERSAIVSVYGNDDFSVEVPFFEIASTGTKALELLYFWMKQLKDASFVFIDEFDAFYHYSLSFSVCKKLFTMLDCQLFLSSHNTYLMTNDLLRPDCNFILDSGRIRPLVECTEKELRFAHNIEKLYRGGTFKG